MSATDDLIQQLISNVPFMKSINYNYTVINQIRKVLNDPKALDDLMNQQLKHIGLTDEEITVLKSSKVQKLPLEKVIEVTGLDEEKVNALYDSAIEKAKALQNG